MEITTWLAGIYLLVLPAAFELHENRVTATSMGAMQSATHLACSWKNSSNQTIEFSLWSPMPASPGQPMVAASESAIEWAGRPAKLVQTSLFNGMPIQAAVAFQQLDDPPSTARIYSTSLTGPELQALLAQAKLATPESPQSPQSPATLCSRAFKSKAN